MTDDDVNSANAPDDTEDGARDDPGDPASPGVVGEQPNRFDSRGTELLDVAPDGGTASDPTESSDDSLPPG